MILQTVPAVLCGSNGCKKVVRCFFDPGSQTSFLQQSVVEELGLDGETVRIAVSGFGRKSARDTLRKRISFTLAPVSDPGKPQGVEALTAPATCCPADAVDVYPTKWRRLQGISFQRNFPETNKRSLMFSLAWISIIPLYPEML